MAVLIEAQGLKKRFGSIAAVDGISLTVRKGEVLGFLGPNGAGKSTTMKMITGFLEPDAGGVRIAGIDMFETPKAAKRKLGYLPEGAPAYGEMTAGDFLGFIAEIRGFDAGEAARRVGAAVEKAELAGVLGQRIETLSKGFKRRVAMAQAILHDPQVLVMDEPTDGLDPNQKHHVRQLIADMAADKAIIVSTHILEEVEAVCSRAIIINKGRIVADGTAEELMRRLPAHGAVAISLASDRVEALRGALGALPGIARIDTVGQANGNVRLRVVPKNGALKPHDVAELLRERAVAVEEIFAERGNLDEVFRQITTSDEAAHA
ncbi:MAG: ABC transporter ATP-binding protein [Hyphomicrobiaceae bacterium]|nr:ABC transporter ATP-binding protein [Hyphomicrobiaceae bacterium]